MTFSERLVALRKEAGFDTRKDFAEAIGVHPNTLRNYETGEREPGHSFLIRVSDYFHVSVDYLLGLSETRYVETDAKEDITSKYRMLDSYGKLLVDTILDMELKRCLEQSRNLRELHAMLDKHLDSMSTEKETGG